MAHFHPGVERWRKLIEELLPEDAPVTVDLLLCMVDQESRGFEYAQSSAGARGLLQLTPIAVKDLGYEQSVFDYWDPETNLKAGIEYMSKMMLRFDHDKRLALAAYNAGPTRVAHLWDIPPFKETQKYVRRILERLELVERKKRREAKEAKKGAPPEPEEKPRTGKRGVFKAGVSRKSSTEKGE